MPAATTLCNSFEISCYRAPTEIKTDASYKHQSRQLAEDDGGMENVYDEVHDALRHGEDMSGEVDDAWRPEQQRYDPQDDGARVSWHVVLCEVLHDST